MLGNTILTVAETTTKAIAALAVALFYTAVVVAWVRGTPQPKSSSIGKHGDTYDTQRRDRRGR